MIATRTKEHYVAVFSRYRKNGIGRGPSWLEDLREEAIRAFAQLGFPTQKDEEWRFTSIEPIVARPFERANGVPWSPPAKEIFSLSFADPAFSRLVFVDGRLAAELSSLRGAAQSVEAGSLARAIADDHEIVRAHLGRCAGHRDRSFVALNAAFFEDGAFVHVPRGAVLEEPLYLIFVSRGGERPAAVHPRNLLVCGEAASARVVECYIGLEAGTYFDNPVTEIVQEPGAVLDHYRLQREGANGLHVGEVVARVGRGASLTAHGITLGGALVRNDVRVALDGEGAQCVLNGLYLVDGARHVDNHTRIDHLKPHATSFELYKGILAGNGHAVFDGKILVHRGAQKSNARQVNRNLLLSDGAGVNTKPQLEIYADDVKCSHGSTIGQLDRDALFYLRSRGLDLAGARSLLSYAFASEVVNRIRIPPMRAGLDEYVLGKFTVTDG
ncbi:MAG TPA: Fe-S cluster assembly protein SufD [candidate division Zixibacteria bacterium]|nr:Fe-S cluster assembly protein SufD [candidate division Zixibacteria bacterium]